MIADAATLNRKTSRMMIEAKVLRFKFPRQ